MKASELKKGTVISIEGDKFLVKEIHVQSPSSRSGSTLYKVQARNVVTKQKLEKNFKGEDVVQDVEFLRRPVQLLYREADNCVFMDTETYEQFALDNSALEQELPFLIDGSEGVMGLVSDGILLGVELPGTVTMEIIECAPGIKGASASARTKPATMPTGLVVQVPEYLSPGEKIKINTANSEFVSRA
jgi:elongation factor P